MSVPIVYDFDSNVDKFYLTNDSGGVISENPVSLNANDYLQGYILTKNNATFDTVTIKIDNNNIGKSFNNERTRCNLSSEYIAGNEKQITFTVKTIGAKTETTITSSLTHSSMNTLTFSFTGANNFVITCDNGYYYKTLPKLTIGNTELTFTENNGVYTLTVDGTQYQNTSSVSVSGTTSRCITMLYNFDSNVDFYQTDSQGNVLAVNPPRLFGNDYLIGYLQTKNNAVFNTITCYIDSTKISPSVNKENNKATFSESYLTGGEYFISMAITTEIIQGVDVTQNLTNCTSSINTLHLDLGSYTITLTANNDTVFNVTPVANYNNVDYTFTLSNDSKVATLEITLDVSNITLTITGSASIASLQGISNFYKPTLEELQYISNHRYKLLSGDNSSERLDLGEYILNLKTVFTPLTTKATEKVILGGNELDVYIHPLNETYIDFTTPDIMIYGYYRNGFDIRNITSFYAMIPFHGVYELDREYINKNIRFSFHIDLSNCNVEVGVYIDSKLTETLSGDCSIDIPYIMEKSLTPKTECFTEHLKIVVNEKTNCNNHIKTIKNDLISNFTGFIKGDVITNSIKATSNELDLLKQLFNEGVYNG